MARLGLEVDCVVADALTYAPDGTFDAVLLMPDLRIITPRHRDRCFAIRRCLFFDCLSHCYLSVIRNDSPPSL